jgi:hypothetical protein
MRRRGGRRLSAGDRAFGRTTTALTDVTRDGSRFLGWSVRGGQPTTLVLVTNWFDELRARVPIAPR